jgi:hypothetical protein
MPQPKAIDAITQAIGPSLRALSALHGHEAVVSALQKLAAAHAAHATPPIEMDDYIAVARMAYSGHRCAEDPHSFRVGR